MSAPVGPPSVARALDVRPAHLDSDRDEANLMASPPGVAQAVERALLGLPGSRLWLPPSQCRWVGRARHVGSALDGLGSRPEIVSSGHAVRSLLNGVCVYDTPPSPDRTFHLGPQV